MFWHFGDSGSRNVRGLFSSWSCSSSPPYIIGKSFRPVSQFWKPQNNHAGIENFLPPTHHHILFFFIKLWKMVCCLKHTKVLTKNRGQKSSPFSPALLPKWGNSQVFALLISIVQLMSNCHRFLREYSWA